MGPKCYGCHKLGHIQRNCPECSRVSAEHKLSVDYSKSITGKKGKKGVKNEVRQTRAEWRYSIDSESDVIGLMTRQVLSAVDSNEADCWIIDSGATCHICNDRRLFIVSSLEEASSCDAW